VDLLHIIHLISQVNCWSLNTHVHIYYSSFVFIIAACEAEHKTCTSCVMSNLVANKANRSQNITC